MRFTNRLKSQHRSSHLNSICQPPEHRLIIMQKLSSNLFWDVLWKVGFGIWKMVFIFLISSSKVSVLFLAWSSGKYILLELQFHTFFSPILSEPLDEFSIINWLLKNHGLQRSLFLWCSRKTLQSLLLCWSVTICLKLLVLLGSYCPCYYFMDIKLLRDPDHWNNEGIASDLHSSFTFNFLHWRIS